MESDFKFPYRDDWSGNVISFPCAVLAALLDASGGMVTKMTL